MWQRRAEHLDRAWPDTGRVRNTRCGPRAVGVAAVAGRSRWPQSLAAVAGRSRSPQSLTAVAGRRRWPQSLTAGAHRKALASGASAAAFHAIGVRQAAAHGGKVSREA